jgi:hypothetical protein
MGYVSFWIHIRLCMIWGSHGGGYKEYYILGYNIPRFFKIRPTLRCYNPENNILHTRLISRYILCNISERKNSNIISKSWVLSYISRLIHCAMWFMWVSPPSALCNSSGWRECHLSITNKLDVRAKWNNFLQSRLPLQVTNKYIIVNTYSIWKTTKRNINIAVWIFDKT